ncbi:PEP-CTERM sorting domain-containing protein [Phycisphaera mikurensis]|uniref:PEP-CTERM sorting domain-containing protein n=1 Tax=Phycisphaera mikurensis TaxID=547188 RepID=UPI00059C4D5B|nr:PEP-CTERM sorting domain-containing protein [Phycisphaera mikurensis]MBB6442281.1 hypothetical protein [Phycisphaera mikurensis]
MLPSLAAVSATALACSAAAAPVALVNGSFEDENIGFITSANASPQPVPGFDVVFLPGGGFYGTDNSRASDPAVDGSNDFYFKNIALTTDAGDRPAAAAGEEYSLLFSGRTEGAGPGITAAIEFFDASGTLIGSESDTFLATAPAFNYQQNLSLAGAIAPTNTASVGIRIENLGTDQTINVDDLRVDVIPEPGSLALLGLGAFALLRRRA